MLLSPCPGRHDWFAAVRYNVCVFAYGQTGSGKTWTMTGGKGEQRGLTPRVIEDIFANIEKAKGNLEVYHAANQRQKTIRYERFNS